jgi:hypothetical protein
MVGYCSSTPAKTWQRRFKRVSFSVTAANSSTAHDGSLVLGLVVNEYHSQCRFDGMEV